MSSALLRKGLWSPVKIGPFAEEDPKEAHQGGSALAAVVTGLEQDLVRSQSPGWPPTCTLRRL